MIHIIKQSEITNKEIKIEIKKRRNNIERRERFIIDSQIVKQAEQSTKS